jgi:hypothetical protein
MQLNLSSLLLDCGYSCTVLFKIIDRLINLSVPFIAQDVGVLNSQYPRVTTGLTYKQLGLRPKILVLTYDQSLELRPACRPMPLDLRPAWRS